MTERYLSILAVSAFALMVASGPVLAQATSSGGGETSSSGGGNTTNDNSSVDSGTDNANNNTTGTHAGEGSPSGDADSADNTDTGTEDNCAPKPQPGDRLGRLRQQIATETGRPAGRPVHRRVGTGPYLLADWACWLTRPSASWFSFWSVAFSSASVSSSSLPASL